MDTLFLGAVEFPKASEGSTVVERCRTALPSYIMEHLDVLEGVLQSRLDIRKEVDASAYMHRDLLQRVRTLAPRVTTV